MDARCYALGAALLVAAGSVFAPVATAALDQAAASGTAVPNFAGRWKVNTELSDKPSAASVAASKDQTAKQLKDGAPKETAAPSASSSSHSPETQTSTEPPPEITVRQTEVEIVAEGKPGEFRSFYPNGKTYKADEGSADVKSLWKDGALVFEKKSNRGWKYTESWQLTPDGKQMRVETRLAGGGHKAAVTKRVYDRVTDAAR